MKTHKLGAGQFCQKVSVTLSVRPTSFYNVFPQSFYQYGVIVPSTMNNGEFTLS